MYFTCDKCVVILLIALAQGLVFASTDSESVSGNLLTTLFANFRRVPWIYGNFTEFREDASVCKNDVARVFQSAVNGEKWALQMLDATSSLPTGILKGNILDLGMYDECIEVKDGSNPANIQGQHCMVSLSISTEPFGDVSDILSIQKLSMYNPSSDEAFSLTSSICLPSTCNVGEIEKMMNSTIPGIPSLADLRMSVAKVTCSPVGPDEFTLGEVLTIAFLVSLVIFLLVSTICDCIQTSKADGTSFAVEVLAKFSLKRNASALLSTKSRYPSLAAISGIRFLTMCMVVLGHRCFSIVLRPRINIADTANSMHEPGAVVMFMIFYVTEVFFVLGGFLRSYFFLKIMDSGKKFNVFADFLHRYIRITPGVAVMTLLSVFIFRRLGSGPLWESTAGLLTSFARENWWTNFLYVQNFVNPKQMFLPHFWYLAVDMQLFWVSPLVMYPLYRWPKYGLVILTLFFVVSLVTPCTILAMNNFAAIVNKQKSTSRIAEEFVKMYIPFYNRATNYFVGIYLGYEIVRKERNLSKARVNINWMLCCATFILCLSLSLVVQPFATEYNLMWELVYVAFGRPAWGIASAWIVYACIRNHGGSLTKFLSLPIFMPLSRLTYSIYLVHFVIQALPAASARSAAYTTHYEVFHEFLGDMVMSVMVAFVIELFVYSPVIVVQNLVHDEQGRYIAKLFPKQPDKPTNNATELQISSSSTPKC